MKRISLFILLMIQSFSVQGLTKVNLALDWYINPDHAPILIAEQQGYFKAQGLQVTLLSPVQSTESAQLVATGQADLAIDYQPSLLMEMAAGLPLIWVGTLVNHPLNCVAVLKDSSIQTLRDLKGHSIGVSASPSSELLLNTMLDYQHVSLGEVKQIGMQMDLSQALLAKKVDAIEGMMRNVEPVQLQSMGYATRLFFPEDNGVPTYDELVIVANKNKVNRAVIKRFNAALAEAVIYLKAHPESSWQQIAGAYPSEMAPSAQITSANKAIWLATIGYFSANPGQLNAVYYNRFMNFMWKKGLLKQPISIEQYQGFDTIIGHS